jgi:hypothetical protein
MKKNVSIKLENKFPAISKEDICGWSGGHFRLEELPDACSNRRLSNHHYRKDMDQNHHAETRVSTPQREGV